MTRPRRTSDEELLEAARAVFLEQGPSASTTAIAERAGVSQAVLFQRFGTKENLLFKALAPEDELPWSDQAEAGPDERPIPAQLRELADQIVEHFEQILPAVTVLRSAGYCKEDIFSRYETPPPVHGHRTITLWFQKALEGGRIGPVDPPSVAMAFAGALQSRVFMSHLLGGTTELGDHDEYLDWLVDFYWRGLSPSKER